MDRLDRQWMHEQRREFNADREADLKAAGPLLQGAKLDAFVKKIEEETRLPRAVVGNIVETINGTAGQPDVDTYGTIKEAFSGHITNPRFLDRFSMDLAKDVKVAIDDREQRIVQMKAAPAAPTVAAPKAAAPSTPGQKS